MNKKNLSVVMAGAMLATSVAPVLADTTTDNTYEVTKGNAGLLIDRLDTLFASKTFDKNDRKADGTKSSFAGTSVYRIEILKDGVAYTTDSNNNMILGDNKTSTRLYASTDTLKTLVKETGASAFKDKIEVKVWELGNRTDSQGRVVSTEVADTTNVVFEKWTQTDLDAIVDGTNSDFENAETKKWVVDVKENSDNSITITLGSKDANGEFNKLTLKAGDTKLDFTTPIDAAGISLVEQNDKYIQANIAGFQGKPKSGVSVGDVIDIAGTKAKELYKVTVNNGDVNYTVNVDDLYDGLMLTEKGHELLEAIKNADLDSKISVNKKDGSSFSKGVSIGALDEKGSERSYTLKFINSSTDTTSVVKIVGKSTEEKKMNTLLGWLSNRKANVDILAGSNRYETAVEIAKTYTNKKQYEAGSLQAPDEVVLVNGEALVDGLAAAPYAHTKDAPILLTDDNTLSKETKEYLKELASKVELGNLNKITVTVIGGEAVVSQNVVDELKDIGFKVKRLAGDNREQTSLAVADEISDANNNTKKAFVVGAEGEADAMSIASFASASETPIIVSKSTKGLSTVALNALSDYDNVEIVGGTSAVSSNDEEKIKEVIDNEDNVTRIAGKNRFETNALVIKKYHSNFDDVLVAKDGQRNKSELVDALAVSIFASVNTPKDNGVTTAAPIVLATDKLSDEQLNQIVLKSNGSIDGTLYQVGYGVSRDVIQKLADRLGLSN